MPPREIMDKFKAGTLKSGSGAPVTNRDQAKAIASSYRAGGDESNLEPKRVVPPAPRMPRAEPPPPPPVKGPPSAKTPGAKPLPSGRLPPERGRDSL